MKRLFYPVLLAFMVIFAVNASATGWSREYEKEVSKGVVYKNIIKYSSKGFSKLHIVECDLTDPGVSIEVMTSQKGSSYLDTTKKMAEDNGSVVAINGDFFNTGSTRTNMLGVVYEDGELVSTPSKDLWATFAVSDTGKIIMDYFGFTGKIISPQGYEVELYQVNKTPATGGAVNMFTPKWGSTVAIGENMQAVLVKDGVVTEKIINHGEIPFGNNDKMFITNYSINRFFDNFNIGDKVQFEYSLTNCYDNIKEATGGNTLLVKDGKRAEFTHNSQGTAQRTAAGVNQDGTKLILLVCEGRKTNVKGMTQAEIADIMIELGAYRAINFDGGGSSTMVIRDDIKGGQEVKNGVTTLRSVSTSLGVFNKLPYIGKPVGGEIVLSSDTVLSGDYVEVYYKFSDENGHTISGDALGKVEISAGDPGAEFEGNKVYFNKGGNQKVYVTAGGHTLEKEVYVIDNVQSAYIYPESITVKEGERTAISLAVWDFSGKEAMVHPESVKWITKGVNMQGAFVEYGTGYIGVEFENASVYAGVNGANKPENTFADTEFMKRGTGKIVRISAGSRQFSSIANMIRVLNYEYSLQGADALYMINKPTIKDINYIGTESFSQKTIENTLVVTLDSIGGSINKNGQLDKIAKLSDSNEKNLIVITKNAPSLLHEEERMFLEDTLNALKNDEKNVFLVYEGNEMRSFLKDGINHIVCAIVKGREEYSNYPSVDKMVEFYIDRDEISYTFSGGLR